MAITYAYPTAIPESQDLLVGTEMAVQGGEDAPRTRTFTIGSIADLIKPYKVYTALLNQSGESEPVATILENTLGAIPVWSYSATGVYALTLAGAFPVAKTLILSANVKPPVNHIRFVVNPTNNILVYTTVDSTAADDVLTYCPIEIRVYN